MDVWSIFNVVGGTALVPHIQLFIAHAHPLLLLVATLLLVLGLFFIWSFLGPTYRLSRALKGFYKELKSLKNQKNVDPRRIEIADDRLSHLWAEYCETLHLPQDAIDPVTGVPQQGRCRATVPAEVIFNSLSVFEGRINAEFFKNLPGLLTGLGIIGTFIGLINGLGAANKGDGELDITLLITSVREAFYISACAIILAMLTTFIEKLVVSGFHRRVEQLCQEIDSLYTSGVGEEYLSRLVNASEESAAQAGMLKDALVGDLRRILEEMTQKQIEAASRQQSEMTRQFGGLIEHGIGLPLGQMAERLGTSSSQSLQDSIAALGEKFERVANGIERTTSSQGNQIAEGMSGSMAAFAQKLDEMLGGQIGHARDLQARTSDSLDKAISSIDTMAAKIGSAGEGAASAVAEQMRSALTEMAERQRMMGDSMHAVAAELRASVANAQSDTGALVSELIVSLSGKVTEVVERLQGNSETLASAHQTHLSDISDQTKSSLAELTGSVQAQTNAIEAATSAMRGTIVELGIAVSSNISRMSEGAGEIRLASEQFVGSGRVMGDILERSRGVASEFTQLAGVLSASARDVSTVVADYRSARDAFASIVDGLRETVAIARRDASLTSEIIQTIDMAAQKLVSAQGLADGYLGRVTDVIGESHHSFATGMSNTLKQANNDFHKHLGTAVSTMASTLEDLDHALSGFLSGGKPVPPAAPEH